MFKCDNIRVTRPCGQLFLIIGFKRNTRDNKIAQWFRNGKPMHFDYLEEKVIANGKTLDDLVKSAEHYHSLEGATS
jgi:hypothetical protein